MAGPGPDLLRRRNLIPLLLLGFVLVLLSGWRSFLYSRQLLIDSQEQSYREVLRVLPQGLLPHLVVDDYVALEQDLSGVMVDPSIAALLVVDPRGRVLAHLQRDRPGGPPYLRYGPNRLAPNSPGPIAPNSGPGRPGPGLAAEVRWQRLEAGGSTLGWLRLSHWPTRTLAVVGILARQYLQLMALTLVVFAVLLTASVLVVQREGRRREAQLEEQGLDLLESSLRDPLTGLANRRGLDLLLEREIARFNASRGSTSAADLLVICLIDLDQFKPINDRYGHAVGDKLLVEVGRRLCQGLRTMAPDLAADLTLDLAPGPGAGQPPTGGTGRLALAGDRGVDQVARLGGDEFVCILAGCATVGQAERLAQRILQSLGQPFALERHSLTVGASLGIAYADGSQAPSALALLQAADHAMYGAKAQGKNHVQFEHIHSPDDLSRPRPLPDQNGRG
jgi:GGDEF domain-containing protein